MARFDPVNIWYSTTHEESVWRYRHAPTYASLIDEFTLIQFPDGWDIHLNETNIGSADTLQEAKDICPMLAKLHGETSQWRP
jgi:hypothetical protein